MDPTDVGLFRFAEQRLAWVDQRQRLLAQNVANANTPGYRPRDVTPFSAEVGQRLQVTTSPLHMQGSRISTGTEPGAAKGRSPDGNMVSLEEQLSRVAETSGTQELVLNLHRRYQSMFRIALGRGG